MAGYGGPAGTLVYSGTSGTVAVRRPSVIPAERTFTSGNGGPPLHPDTREPRETSKNGVYAGGQDRTRKTQIRGGSHRAVSRAMCLARRVRRRLAVQSTKNGGTVGTLPPSCPGPCAWRGGCISRPT